MIINPDIFNSYGHLEWNNVQDVPASTLNQYKTTNLVRRESDPTIYRIFPDGDGGSKAQITLTVEQFQTAGIDIDSIYTINNNEFNLYATIQPITTPEEYTEQQQEQTPETPTTPEPQQPTITPQPPVITPPPPTRIISSIDNDRVSAPTQLRATNQTLTTLTIQWRQTQDAQQGYEIQWCNGNCNPNDEWDNTTTIAERETTTHTIENLNLQTTYKIRIKALKTQTRQSRYATITYTMVLPKPTNTTTTAHTTTSVTLNWQQVDGATAGYEIQYKKPTQTSWSTAITATSTETSKQIPTLDSGTTYQVRIRALRTNTPNNIPSAYTTITTTTTPEPPTALTFSNQTTNSTTLSWTAPTQGDNLTYAIEYCSNLTNCQAATPQGSWTTTKTLTSSTTTTTIPQLTQSTQYNIRVRTTKTINNATTNSSWIASSFITKPEAPTNASITPARTSITVEWDEVTGASSYNIQYCKGTCTQETQTSATTEQNRWRTGTTATNTETSKQITGLTPRRNLLRKSPSCQNISFSVKHPILGILNHNIRTNKTGTPSQLQRRSNQNNHSTHLGSKRGRNRRIQNTMVQYFVSNNRRLVGNSHHNQFFNRNLHHNRTHQSNNLSSTNKVSENRNSKHRIKLVYHNNLNPN